MSFSLNLNDLAKDTVSIIAASMVNDKLARVVISYVGEPTKASIANQVGKQLNGLGSIVESSFRELHIDGLGKMAVGFVKANREVRMPSEAELRANYRVLSSNILRSNEDRSLWELKQGKNTTYLAKHGNEDLSALVDMCTAHVHPTSCVTSAVNASVAPESYDLVAFVNDFGDTDYGFVCVAGTDKSKVVAHSTRKAVVISNQQIIESREVKIDPVLASAVKKRVLADTKDGSTADMEDYYRTLFSYDEEYMKEFLDDVRQMSGEIA